MPNFKFFLKNTMFFTVSQIFLNIGSLLLLPIFTFYLNTEQYGIIGIVNTTSSFLSLIFLFGLVTAQYKYYVDLKQNKTELGEFLFTINFFIMFLNIIFILLVIFTPLGPIFYHILIHQGDVSFNPYMYDILAILFLSVVQIITRSYLVAEQRFSLVIGSDIVQFILRNLFGLILIIYFNMGALGPIYGFIISMIFTYFILYLFYIKQFILKVNLQFLKSALIIGIPVLLNAFIGALASNSNILIIQNFVSIDDLGLFAIALTFGNLITIIYSSFNSIWITPFNEIMKDGNITRPDIKLKLRKVFYLYTLLLTSFCIIYQLGSSELIVVFLNPKFHGIIIILPILIAGNVASGYYHYFVNFLSYHKQTYFIPFVSGLSLIINILLNLMLSTKIGLVGAVISFALTQFFFSTLIHFIALIKYVNFEINYLKIIIANLLIFNPIIFELSTTSGIESLIPKLAYFLIFVIVDFILFKDVIIEYFFKIVNRNSIPIDF